MPTNKRSTPGITQAVMLAAGMGTRLGPLTASVPKCMVPVCGQTMLERAITRLETAAVEELIVVTGYKHQVIEDCLNGLDSRLRFRFIHNADYDATNNIYSLWLAAEQISGSFYLLESDLIYTDGVLADLTPASAAALSPLESWMDGTIVTLDTQGQIDGIYLKSDPRPLRPLYKTVNLYTLEAEAWHDVLCPRLKQAIDAGNVHTYYEAIFAQAVRDGAWRIRGSLAPVAQWQEIDTPEDLQQAEVMLRA